MALAVTVVMLMTLLAVALITRSQNALEGAAHDTDRSVATAAAEQGLAEALARIDAGQRSTFTGNGSVPGGTFRYEATAVGGNSFVVYAEAEVDGVTRAVEGTIGGRPLFPYTLFVDSEANLADNLGRISGRLGTNGHIDSGGATVRQDLYGRRASCDKCSDPLLLDGPIEVDSPTPPDLRDVPGGRYGECPTDGIFTGVVSSKPDVPIVCDPDEIKATEIVFSDGLVVVDGPLAIYVLEGLGVRFEDAKVNAGGDPSDLQLFFAGRRSRDYVVFESSRVSAVVYAPGRISKADRSEIVGSFTIGEIGVGRGQSLSIEPSAELEAYEVSGWRLSFWEAVDPR